MALLRTRHCWWIQATQWVAGTLQTMQWSFSSLRREIVPLRRASVGEQGARTTSSPVRILSMADWLLNSVLSSNSMHCPIDVIMSPHLKGLESKIGALPGFPNQSIIKIRQANNFVYLQYHNNQDLLPSRAELPNKLCQLNGITEGASQAQAISGVTQCKKVTVFVSKLDWQIINNRSTRLEEQFLNQITLVWPQAKIPLFYDRSNSVTLRIQCECLSLLGENSELDIQVQASQDDDKQALRKQEILDIEGKDLKRHLTDYGNINVILMSPTHPFADKINDASFKLQFLSHKLQTIPTDTTNLTVREQLTVMKSPNNPEPKSQKIRMPVEIMVSNQLKDGQISISSLVQPYFGLTPCEHSIQLIKSQLIEPKSLKFDFLLSSVKNLQIEIKATSRADNLANITDTKNALIHTLTKIVRKGSNITVYSKIPFVFGDSQVGYLTLKDKRKDQSIGDPIALAFPADGQQEQSYYQQIENKLKELVAAINCHYPQQNDDSVMKQPGVLLKLERLQSLEINFEQLRPTELFSELYKICYAAEIAKIKDYLSDVNARFLLITSFGNNGKTVLHHILREHGLKILYIEGGQFDDTSLTLGDISTFLEMCFQLWEGRYIFLDNIDSVCYRIDSGDIHRRQERIAAKLILRKILNLSKIYGKVCVLTAKNQGNIDQQLRHFQLVKMKNPALQDRVNVLKKTGKYEQDVIAEMAAGSESMSFGEFSKYAITGHKPSVIGESKVLRNDFSRLAGVEHAKKLIRSIIYKPLKYSFVFKKLPVKLSRAVLLYGGSGTGKSAIGAALADQFQMKYFNVKGSDILSKYIGGSEAAVRDIFEKAMSVSPSIIFFDQFETIVTRRNSSNTGVTDRVVNQFLCYLDGVASIQGVFIVAASSRPDLIDPALLRPGRIDSHIFLDYPEASERQHLLELYSNSIHFQSSLQEVVQMTQNYSYSDLIGLIKELRIKKSADVLASNQDSDPKQFKYIDAAFLKQTVENYKLSVSKSEQQKQREKYLAFKRGDAPDISKQKVMLH